MNLRSAGMERVTDVTEGVKSRKRVNEMRNCGEL